MAFALIAKDNTTPGTLDRRKAVREAHLALMLELKERGIFRYGGALLDAEGNMAGSMLILDYANEDEIRADYLAREPYVSNDVWGQVEIRGFAISPHFTL